MTTSPRLQPADPDMLRWEGGEPMTTAQQTGRGWWGDIVLGLAVAALGLYEALGTDTFSWLEGSRGSLVVVVLAMAGAVTVARRFPAAALGIIWLLGAYQIAAGVPLMLVQLAVVWVSFATARWGRAWVVVVSGLSMPTALVIAFATLGLFQTNRAVELLVSRSFYDLYVMYGSTAIVGVGAVALGILAVPWLAGLAVRFGIRARTSQAGQAVAEQQAAEAEIGRGQAEEIARLREGQAQLANDVHDVVGHSLAVILAQAESGQYLPDDNPAALKETLATIAGSARTSLQDVRQVLSQQREQATTAGLDSLIEGLRGNGHEVVATEIGVVQPLPPELETVAYRVLQEMLTNAIRHGARGRPVQVERHWEGELRIEVRNEVTAEADPTAMAAGQGVSGMRRRLEVVGGRLDVRRREDPPTWTATAWVPVRTVTR